MTVAIQFSTCLVSAVLAAFSAAATATETSSVSVPHSDSVPIELQFAGEFAGKPFDCGARYENIGLSQATVSVSDFRLYVSRIRLLDNAGNQTPVELQSHGPWQYDGVALLDFENASAACSNGTPDTNAIIKMMAPAGDYTGVAFDIGVPFESNHQDPTLAASPLNLTSLFWNWRGGYRFMRVDLQPVGVSMSEQSHQAGASQQGSFHEELSGKSMHGKGWALHLGSTGCRAVSPTHAPESCMAPNRVEVEFSAAAPDQTIFVIDPARLLAGSDVTSNSEGSSPGCMSAPDDPDCEAVFKLLGLAAGGASQSLVTTR